MDPFQPFFRHAHLSTLAGNFWKRALEEARFPTHSALYQTAPGTRVLVHENRPPAPPKGHLLLLHGLQGSSASGYMVSMAQSACEAGYHVHRLNMRGCGGTEHLTDTLYNAGLTEDVHYLIDNLPKPLFLIGYSLGGNVMLKLAGELGASRALPISGVIAVSTPIDLAACVRKMSEPQNRLYEWRFVLSLCESYRRRHQAAPERFPLDGLSKTWTVYDFDDRFTAKHFGFGSADNYYRTQSALRFLDAITVPTLVVQAKNDPLIPFDVFESPALQKNPRIAVRAVDHGGHLGFVSRTLPRFWLDGVLLQWIEQIRNKCGVSPVSGL